jgi:hypothetical protein
MTKEQLKTTNEQSFFSDSSKAFKQKPLFIIPYSLFIAIQSVTAQNRHTSKPCRSFFYKDLDMGNQ